MERVAHVEQPVVRLAYALVRPIGQPGRRQREQHRHVAEPAPRLLQVGLLQVGGVPVGREPLVQGLQQLRQPLPGAGPPRREQPRPGRADQRAVPGDQPQVEQADPGAELLAGHRGALRRGPDRVVESDPGVPERIPQLVGQSRDLGRLPVVQQHQVDVGPWTQLASGEAADRGQRDAGGRGPDSRVQLDQRRLDRTGHQTPTIRPSRGFPRGPDRDVETLAG